MSKRLATLQSSLAKKEAEFDRRLSDHMADVRSANGQPLNDKRNGNATLSRWDRQDDSLRRLKEGIAKTKQAIEREQAKIDNVNGTDIPDALREMAERGELKQWRKHPNTFFVPGVDKARIVWDAKAGTIGIRYLSEVIPDQYPALRDTFNRARAAMAKVRSA